jgi:hypothetical protein
MTEFLHQVVANREYRQHDIVLHRALREQILRGVGLTDDPWEVSTPVTYPTNEDLGTV